MHGIKPEVRFRTMIRGWFMGALVVGELCWIPFSGLSLGSVAAAVGYFAGSGIFIGREVYFRTFRKDFLGVFKGTRDGTYWFWVLALTLNGFLVLLGQTLEREFSFVAAGFILWWGGVLIATWLAVKSQMRLEQILLQADWREDDPHWFRVREMAKNGVRYEGALLRRLRKMSK